MSDTIGYPACFPSQHAFDEWKKSAKTAKEAAAPCDDCSRPYQSRAGAACQPTFVRGLFTWYPKNFKEEPGELDDDWLDKTAL